MNKCYCFFSFRYVFKPVIHIYNVILWPVAMAGFHVSSLKPNDVSANLRLGTFALKWPEETNKPVVINYL